MQPISIPGMTYEVAYPLRSITKDPKEEKQREDPAWVRIRVTRVAVAGQSVCVMEPVWLYAELLGRDWANAAPADHERFTVTVHDVNPLMIDMQLPIALAQLVDTFLERIGRQTVCRVGPDGRPVREIPNEVAEDAWTKIRAAKTVDMGNRAPDELRPIPGAPKLAGDVAINVQMAGRMGPNAMNSASVKEAVAAALGSSASSDNGAGEAAELPDDAMMDP